MKSVDKYKSRLLTFTNYSIYQNDYNIYHRVLELILFPYFCLFFTFYSEYVLYVFVAIRY